MNTYQGGRIDEYAKVDQDCSYIVNTGFGTSCHLVANFNIGTRAVNGKDLKWHVKH